MQTLLPLNFVPRTPPASFWQPVSAKTDLPPVTTTPEIAAALSRDCVVAVGVSGGKDSVACALATARYLG